MPFYCPNNGEYLILKLKNKVRALYRSIQEDANEILVSGYENNNSKKFLDLFTKPVIKQKSKTQITSNTEDPSIIELNDILQNKNYIIFGNSKSGRTSILYKIYLDILNSFPVSKQLAIYLDFRELKINSTYKSIDWIQKISRQFEITRNKAENIITEYNFKILIDNYSPDYNEFNSKLEALVCRYNINIVITTEESMLKTYNNSNLFTFKYTTLYIHDISRKNVRSLVQKWPNIQKESEDIVLDKIAKVFNQLNISFNYWTVSLFLWIFEKTNDVSLNSNVELINLYIDELLDRSKLATNNSINIKFDELKNYLGALAYFLLTDHRENLYSVSYVRLLQFTTDYKKANIRFVIDEKEIVDMLINKGVIKKDIYDRFTFRLNGVFEYFLAVHMKNNHDFRQYLISNNYLAFANELELYAGFESKDQVFIKSVLDRTTSVFKEINSKYGTSENMDYTLISKFENLMGVEISISTLSAKKLDEMNALSAEEQDEVMDDLAPINLKSEEVKLKDNNVHIDLNLQNLEKSLKILARVYRNSTLDNLEFNKQIFNYIILCSCHFGFSMLDDISQKTDSKANTLSNNKEQKNHELLIELTAKFMPLILNTFLADALAQENLERVILERVQELKAQKDNNSQFETLILYLLLIDSNPLKKVNYFNDLINSVSLGLLRHTILLKLYSFLVFYSYKSKRFETTIKDYIRKLHRLINPKGTKYLDKHLESLSKKSLVEKVKNIS